MFSAIQVLHVRRLTRKTCSKISVGLSIWPRMTIISLSMNSLNSRRLQVMFISSSVRICTSQGNRNVTKWSKLKPPGWQVVYSYTSLQVTFSRSFCIMISLRRVLICRSVSSLSVGLQKRHQKQTSLHYFQLSSCRITELYWDTYTSEKSTGESARCDCTSCMAFHSLMRTWSEETLLW